MKCPDDGAELAAEGLGPACPRCQGELWSEEELVARAPALSGMLTPETRPRSGAFARRRICPSCAAPMAPLRIAKMDAWADRCPECQSLWLEKQDVRTVSMLERQHAIEKAYRSFSPEERREMARSLASEFKGPPRISGFHAALAAFGLPVVRRLEGNVTPYATWALAVLLTLVFAIGSLTVGVEPLVTALGYRSDQPTLLSALSANLGHFGWLHLLGNVYFLLAFGDGVEQRVPRPLVWVGFFALGAVATCFQGLMAGAPALIAGASAGVSALMGACFVLQPRARVITGIAGEAVEVPILVYGAFEVGYQLVMTVAGAPGAAWYAHLSGLALGAAAGFAWGKVCPTPSAPLSSSPGAG